MNSQKVNFKGGRTISLGIARKPANLRNKNPALSSKAYYLELKNKTKLEECGPQITSSLSNQDVVPKKEEKKSPVADKECGITSYFFNGND